MKLKAVFNRLFTDRQVILGTHGQLKYFHLSVPIQIMGITVIAGFAGLFLFFMATDTLKAQRLSLQSAELIALQTRYQTAATDRQLAQSKLAATKAELDQQYARLEGVLSNRKAVANTLKLANKDVEDTSPEDRIRALGESLHVTASRREQLELEVMQINKMLFHTSLERDQAATDYKKTERKLASMRGLLNLYASTKDQIYKDLQDSRLRFANLEADRKTSLVAEKRLSGEVSNLQARIGRISTENKNLIARIHDRTNESVMALREIIVLTGLDPDKLLGAGDAEGQGGPLFTVNPDRTPQGPEQNYYTQAEKMEASLARWESLQSILKMLPLARPVDVGYVTSTFGDRRDPITKRTAYHSGIDIAGPKNSKVLATAPGVVSFAGRNGAYGNMVTIDHGQGFQTRYGHLKKITVKIGDEIDFRTQVGVMGSTGRSTGRHVHYEIIYEGEHQDPLNFIKAGKYAFKATPKLQNASAVE
ncbi:peptidoglycan DD-metalloendopeptidase family protein [Sneathiella sp.]|uniref:peptidoglycan DD-metalloendopeptidase family protein n=1 Tax=Sneathiella sp. TaxID=1964365 RepID=UPI0035673ABA